MNNSGNMWGWYGNQWYPPLMGAWCRMKLGWVKVKHVTASKDVAVGPACANNKIYKIDHNMQEGEYFLIEYRFPCGFDGELTHHSYDWTKDRSGAALWHVDESGLLDIDYTSEGIPSGGSSPVHYEVSMIQADGNFDLETGANKGDRFDLFMAGDYANILNKSYKISNSGITKNSGDTLPEPNTNSYASGQEKPTGITLTFGGYAYDLPLSITLQ